MKTTYARRYRRPTSRSREGAMAKKNNQQEHTFFAAPSFESFFKPNVSIQRKCAQCEAEETQARRMSEPKEEEKKVQKEEEKKVEEKEVDRIEDKKEEKEVQKTEEKKEGEKPVQKMEEKKEEEKPVQKVDDKKEEEKPVQKMEEKKEEEKPVQKMEEKKEEEKPVQKMEEKKEEEKVAKKEAGPARGHAAASSYIHGLDGKGQALPEETRHFFRKRIGYDFSQVKIHTGTEAELSARQINAKAYAVGNHIVFSKGAYDPDSEAGKKLLAHELTHVVQNNKPELLKAGHRPVSTVKKQAGQPGVSAGKETPTPNKKAFACAGVEVQAETTANYRNSFTFSRNMQPSAECEDCSGPDCISGRGTIVSVFRAQPVVTLPPVPEGLSTCERRAVSTFINTTLRQHEQRHVAAFNTYNGTVRTPYTYTGCKSGLNAYVQSIHDDLNTQRQAAANALSDALDPFNPTIPCNC